MRPVVLGLALFLPAVSQAGVVINEFMPDPSGADTGFEWIELYNTDTTNPVDISGWKVEAGTSAFGLAFTVPASSSIPAGGYVVIGDPSVTGATILLPSGTLGLPNATSSADAVRIKDAASAVVDTVVYGTPNSDSWIDDSGATATSLAPPPVQGKSLARTPNGADTNASSVDFWVPTTVTMGAANDTRPTCSVVGTVKINEFASNPAGADDGSEWVELYNPGGAPVDVSGWSIQSGTSTFSVVFPLPNGTMIPAQGYLLVGESNVSNVNVNAVLALNLGNATSNSDGLRLVDCAGTARDTVIYGTPNTDSWKDDSGAVATSMAPGNAADGTSQARKVDGVDTDLSGADFAFDSTPTPGAANDPAPDTGTGTCSTGVAVKINELMPDPAGTDAGNEYVELYNNEATSVDLSGWNLVAGTSTFNDKFAFPSGTTLAPGDFLLVGQANVAGAVLHDDAITLGNATSNSDGVRLEDCKGTVVDTVVYGTPNTDALVDDGGTAATSLAPKPGSGQALARVDDGADTNQSAVDFAVAASPTPGAGNHTGTTATCSTGVAVKINELMSDPAGADAGNEYVELYNVEHAEVDLSGWNLVAGTQTFNDKFVFPVGTKIGGGQILLVGQSLVPGADVIDDGISLGNATSNSDAVRLEDCKGTVVDTVVYGTPNSDGFVDDNGTPATSLAPKPTSGKSIARHDDGLDTNMSAADFSIASYPTPGLSNHSPPIDCGAAASDLKINEFLANSPGADSTVGTDWVELYNAGSSPVTLTGWAIERATTTSWTVEGGLSGVIAAGDYLLVGGPNVPNVDIAVQGFDPPSGTGGDGLRVVDCKGYAADTVVYGGANTDRVVDDSGSVAVSVAPAIAEGQVLQRVTDGYDTDASGVDFAIATTPTPGASNSPIEPVVCEPSVGVVTINEIVPDPDGTDSGNEWFELYNTSGDTVSVAGWYAATATQASGETDQDVLIPGGTSIGPEGFLIIGGGNVAGADVIVNLGLGNGTDGDAIVLYDCEGNKVDTVIYGKTNADAMIDDNGVAPTASYGNPGSAMSLARVEDGVDSDLAVDWKIDASPTPGGTNYTAVIIDTGGTDSGGCHCGGGPPTSGAPTGNGCSTVPVSPALSVLLGLAGAVFRRRRRE